MEMCDLNAVQNGSIAPPKNVLSTINIVKLFFFKKMIVLIVFSSLIVPL